ncbi:hypothetical protein PY365_29480 [Roseiarcaceae bacterium H3SJ34-1]|uniref:hypothetical protein n=1 Tax=Terripilifer ovatus TaxID=3032367 RepID=UPI003AB9BC26|nr:hypothetical protein [Roseiarcaceae bacterium H3SJ34-1]
MYTAQDPRSSLAPAARATSTPTAFSAASYCRFYETPPQDTDQNGRVWYGRGANFLVAYTLAEQGGAFSRKGQIDEWAIIVPDRDVRVEIETPASTTVVEPYSIAFVPPGDSTVRVPTGGRIIRIFSTQSADIAAKCENAATYASAPPNIPPFQPWPAPKDGFRVRAYSLDVGGDSGRFGRIFRCTTLMINYLDPRMGPRDTAKLSPHHHDDFEQGSLVLDGDYIHDIRWPWTPDMAIWREDEHAQCGAPSLTVIPPPTVHTSRSIAPGLNQMVDLFSPPRVDFSMKPGWVLNADDYPMPESR